MLAPGELLTQPAAEASPPATPAAPQTPNTGTAPKAPAGEEPWDDDSFLMRLLRALGAIHT
jgi:hypothetical protein